MKLIVDLELVQVRVGPAHRRLDVLVELFERAVPDLDSPPDRRLDVEQRDLELVEEVGLLGASLRHAIRLAGQREKGK